MAQEVYRDGGIFYFFLLTRLRIGSIFIYIGTHIGGYMSKANYTQRSIRIPQWIDRAVREMAEKDRRSVSAQIEYLVEAQLLQFGLASGSGAESAAQAEAV